jgi:hypothetical protein
LILIFGLTLPIEAMAQTAVAKFHIRFSGTVDCQQPVAASNIPNCSRRRVAGASCQVQ